MLNSAQQEAVETLSGPLLVLAGAGTGKTRVVTYRTARLIKNNIEPDRILAVTFTNKAAREMQTRIGDQLSGKKTSKPEISTFHSLCVRILRRRIHYLGFPNQFTIYDRGDQESVARQILRNIKIAGGALRPGDFLARISEWKSHGITADSAMNYLDANAAKDYISAYAYKRYQDMLKTLGAVDFDDLLLLTEELFQKYPEALAEESARFDHILVDEYQDTNLSQYRIIKGLALPHRNLCVVGDDDQAIYGWRGAEVTHILNFQKDWPDAKIIRLERNYRSTRPIITWANRVISFNRTRHAKMLKTDVAGVEPKVLQCKDGETEAKTVVSIIKNRISDGRRPKEIAILFRTNEQPRQFEMELRNQKIPYILIGGQSFFDRKEVKDILAYLKFFLRPQDDISLLRIINTPGRGIGSTTIEKIRIQAQEKNCSLWDIIGKDDEFIRSLDKKSADAVRGFSQLSKINAGRLRKKFTPEDLTDFIEQINYKGEIERNYEEKEDQEAHWNSVGEIIDAAASYLKENPNGSMSEFLDNTSLGGGDFTSGNEKKLDRNAVALMTYHAAKGLEFQEVFMVGMEEGILPHHQSVKLEDEGGTVDEERRLCYVGITRAQRRLTLTLASARLKWGKNRPTIPSRFLYEATGRADNPHYEQIKNGELKAVPPTHPANRKGTKK